MKSSLRFNRYPFVAAILVCLFFSVSAYADGSITSWGWNGSGQCSVPSPNMDFTAVSAGVYHSLGLKADGSIAAWGQNNDGQCTVPSPNTGFKAIGAGYDFSIGLKNDGSIAAWGWNRWGQCNLPSSNTDFKAITTGYLHSLGLKNNGSIAAWGYNGSGQCTVPSPNSNFKAVAAGDAHSLGLKNDGSIVAWGDDGDDQCSVPSPNSDFKAIAASGYHSLGLKNDGSIVAWGDNGDGQCDVPPPNSNFKAIAAGAYYSLGLKNDGSIVAWGKNDKEQCNVPSGTDFTAISAGSYHGLGLKGSNAVSIIRFGNIPGQKNTKLTVNDFCDVPVTLSLTGGGYGEVSGDANEQITLHDTGEKSMLTISTPKGKTANISKITVNGSLKGIMAKTTNLGDDITITGSLGTLTLKDAEGSISIGSSSNPKAAVTMVFDIVNDLDIDSETPIKSITATDWVGGSANAATIGSITIKGDKKRGIKGDLHTNVSAAGAIGSIKVANELGNTLICKSIKSIATLDINEAVLILTLPPDSAGKMLALGTLTAKGRTRWSQIASNGHIGTMTFGIIKYSTCFAGVVATEDGDSDEVLDLPDPSTDINYSYSLPATIKSIKISGIKGETYGMINTNIAAANILSASFANPEFYGGSDFGIAADYIKSLKIKDTIWSYSGTLNIPGDVPTNVPGDFKINIK